VGEPATIPIGRLSGGAAFQNQYFCESCQIIRRSVYSFHIWYQGNGKVAAGKSDYTSDPTSMNATSACVFQLQGSDLSRLLVGFEALLSHLRLGANPGIASLPGFMTRMPALQLR
jgi:hypothetical protein